MSASPKIAPLAVALWFATASLASAQMVAIRPMGPELQVRANADISGDVSVTAWSREGGHELASVLSQIVHCRGGVKPDGAGPDTIVCAKALNRDGLTLEGVVDLAPIARNLDAKTGIQLWMYYPRLGFESSSMPMTDDEEGITRTSHTVSFEPGIVPPPIHFRFGYRSDQLAGIYLPVVLLALALTLIATIMSRARLAALSRSVVLLGTIVWMGAVAQLQADDPLRLLLYGSPFATFAALFVEFWPPLFCVAIGVALGSRMRPGQARRGKAGEIFGSFAVIPLIFTCVVGALPAMTSSDWPAAAAWLATTPIVLILRRAWIRARARSKVIHLSGGEFGERVSALAARAGNPKIKVYISFSTRSQISNAFALPGRSIFLTAPLVRSFSKREVDAIAAHELSHFRYSNRGQWSALCLAMLFCLTPIRDTLLFWPGGLLIAMMVPLVTFFVSLRGMRRAEFAADANAAVLTGDPRAMISSLARVSRSNDTPLDMNPVAEWISSHPSTTKRIRALATAARLGAAEVESLCIGDEPSDHYDLPQPVTGASKAIFTLAWQKANAGAYSWAVIFLSAGAGIFVAWLLDRFPRTHLGASGAIQVVAGIALGCLITKGLSAALMSSNYARLRRRLEKRLGIRGQLVGLALDGEPRLYNSFRFSDAGLLRFDRGRLCYQSEHVTIALNRADVVEVGMVSASPSFWIRLQPMVRFRQPESGAIRAFILHPVDWLPKGRRLLKTIERWRASESSPESTSTSGFNPVAGQPYVNPTIIAAVRGFFLPGCLTAAAIAIHLFQHADWWFAGCAMAISACSFGFMFLPSMLYRPPAPSPELTVPVDAS